MASRRAALLPMRPKLCSAIGRQFSGITSLDEASPADARACAARFSALGARPRRGPPIARRSAGAISLFSTPPNFPLFFDCYGGLDSLIARKIRLIHQVTNSTCKRLKYGSLLRPHPRRLGLGTRFSLYLASNGVADLSRPTRQSCEGRSSTPSVGTEAAARAATRLQHQDIPSSELRRDADMTNRHRRSVLRGKDADIVAMILPAAGVT
jgi:hypothetical protein